MPDFTEKPTNEFITDTKAYLESVYREVCKHWEDLDGYLHETYTIWPHHEGRNKESYHSSTPANKVAMAMDSQLNFSVRAHREPTKNTTKDKEAADRIERALTSIMSDAFLDEMANPFHLAGSHLIHYGYSPLEAPILDWLSRPMSPRREKGESDAEFKGREKVFKESTKNWNPIGISAPHPASVMIDPESKRPVYAIKTVEMRAGKLAEMSKRKAAPSPGRRKRGDVQEFNLEGRGYFDTVKVVHFHSKHWTAVKVEDGDILWIDPNIFGFVRYTHAFSGWGLQSIAGDLMKDMSRGLLSPILGSLRAHDQQINANQRLLMRAAYAPMGSSDPEQLQKVLAQGGVVEGDREDFWTMETQQIASWIFEVGRETGVDITEGTVSNLIGGFREPGVTNVGNQAMLSVAASKKFQTLLLQLQHMATIVAENILQTVDVLSQNSTYDRIGVNGNYLTSEDINGDYNVTISFEDLDPALQLQNREVGMRENQQGLKSWERYQREDAKLEDISREREAQAEDQVRAHPGVRRIINRKAAIRIGLGEEFDGAMAEEEAEEEAQGQPSFKPRDPGEGEPNISTRNNARQSLDDSTQNPAR